MILNNDFPAADWGSEAGWIILALGMLSSGVVVFFSAIAQIEKWFKTGKGGDVFGLAIFITIISATLMLFGYLIFDKVLDTIDDRYRNVVKQLELQGYSDVDMDGYTVFKAVKDDKEVTCYLADTTVYTTPSNDKNDWKVFCE